MVLQVVPQIYTEIHLRLCDAVAFRPLSCGCKHIGEYFVEALLRLKKLNESKVSAHLNC